MKKNSFFITIIIILFISFCASQYLVHKQNKVISEYSDMIDEWVEAYGKCMGEKIIILEKNKEFLEIKHEADKIVENKERGDIT